jgi:NAD-dependent dihydropyrimidine dehydrogenase PreA subunit
MPDGSSASLPGPSGSEKGLEAVFIEVEVDGSVAADADLSAKLEEVCPVDIFKAGEGGVEIVRSNLDECVLCNLCVDAAPEGTVRIVKLYEG